MSYIEKIQDLVSPSLDNFIRIACDELPTDKRLSPWIGLSHGVKILTNENELNQYLCAYGNMHKEKLTIALESIDDPQKVFNNKINIVDWGCGQGLATICLLDYLNKLGIRRQIDFINLIEPSQAAIKRAGLNINQYNLPCRINSICEVINKIEPSDIILNDNLTIHFFSNILDIETIDLQHLVQTINELNVKNQIFICVGPQNIGSSRIKEFSQLLNIPEKDLIESYTGRLSSRGTISLLIFKKEDSETKVIKVAYQHIRKPNISNGSALLRILQEEFNAKSYSEQIIHYYRKIIEYEKLKSESIEVCNCQCYPIEFDENNDISRIDIDIQSNKTFEKEFVRNFDTRHNNWPKNLNIGLCVILNGKAYRLLQYIYPQEDIRSIDITSQYISINLFSFNVNSVVADELELGKEMIDTIEQIVSDKNTSFNKVEKILRDAISNKLVLDKNAYLAFTSENPALIQIYKELRVLENIKPNDTLSDFLKGHIENNRIAHVNKDTLIHVKEMDRSQREAIAAALNYKFSVITGPPGTGKTQLILNLIANALYYNKSVLVASKNNKAVDNIKERYDSIDGHHYLLRFGSRDMVENQLIPYLERTINEIPYLEFNIAHSQSILTQYKESVETINKNQKIINEIIVLRDNVLCCKKEIEKLSQEANDLKRRYEFNKNSLEEKFSNYKEYYYPQINWLQFIEEANRCLNKILRNSKGLKALFFNWIYYKKLSQEFYDIINRLPQIQQIIQNKMHSDNNMSKSKRLSNECKLLVDLLSNISKYGEMSNSLKQQFQQEAVSIQGKINSLEKQLLKSQTLLDSKEGLETKSLEDIKEHSQLISNISSDLFKILVENSFSDPNCRSIITRYKNYIHGNEPIRAFNDNNYLKSASEFLNIFKLNAVTNLSVKNAYPLQGDLFDCLIIDEASQCDVTSAIPLIYRAKQVIVIGDPLQLKHISAINISEEIEIKKQLKITENPFARYSNYSLWDYCKDLISSASDGNRTLVLDNHYRCNPQIMGYSNEMFYKRKLGITLNIKTIEKNPQIEEKGIIWEDVQGEQESETRNVNLAEVKKSIDLAVQIANKYPNIEIGIISPFKDQAQEISTNIPSNLSNRITSNTVHVFQGDEKDVIIYSLVVTNNSPITKIRWIDYSVPNLVNVAVTRARTTLYVIGNRSYIRENSNVKLPLGYLEYYATNSPDSIVNIDNKSYIIDTNVFIDCTNIIKFINPRSHIIIPAKVIDELEKLKISKDECLRTKAETALKIINKSFYKKIRIENSQVDLLPFDYNKKQPDNLILSVAIKYHNQTPTLLSSDNGLLIKARGLGIRALTLKEFIDNNYE